MITPLANPIDLFRVWFKDAEAKEKEDPYAMALATVNSAGFPSIRTVLLKKADEDGFIFCTNLESNKSKDIIGHPKVALCFYWKILKRQVRVEGIAKKINDKEADVFFQKRLRTSQITTIVSKQSRILTNRKEFEQQVADQTLKLGDQSIPRPSFWSGYCIQPTLIEFWQEQNLRLDDRLVYSRNLGNAWQSHYLYP
jgi:pyridoxamine 5'-phosphate oxidase